MSAINGFSMLLRGVTLIPRYLETVVDPVPNKKGNQPEDACSDWGHEKFKHGEGLQALWS